MLTITVHETVYLPETKHLPQLEAPDKVLEQIKWFT